MAYRDILVHADIDAESDVRLQSAAELAVRFGAEVTGVFVSPPFIPPPMSPEIDAYVAAQTVGVMVEDHRRRTAEDAERARQSFLSAVARAGGKGQFAQVDGDTIDPLLRLARCFDLVILSRQGVRKPPFSAVDVAFGVGGPVLLGPEALAGATVGGNVLVCWNATREAARALRGAWPVLEQARQVHLLMVSPPLGSDAPILRHFERHEVTMKPIIDRGEDRSAGEIIQRRAHETGADLVVMGLYGHSRLTEKLLGGASRTMLDQDNIPLLAAH